MIYGYKSDKTREPQEGDVVAFGFPQEEIAVVVKVKPALVIAGAATLKKSFQTRSIMDKRFGGFVTMGCDVSPMTSTTFSEEGWGVWSDAEQEWLKVEVKQ